MSNFVAEASVVIRPVADPKLFAAAVQEAITAAQASVRPIVIPIAPVAGGAATAGIEGLAAAQTTAEASALGLANAAQVEASAFGQLALSLDAATIASEAETVASGAQQAATERAARTTAALTAAQRAGITAMADIAAISSAGAVATTELALTRARLLAANTAVSASEAAVTKALAARNIAVIDAASNTLSLARADQVQATTAFENAQANRLSAASAAESGLAHAQATRGFGATVLAMLGLRGATLAASGPFLVGAASAVVFSKSLKEATDQVEELNKTDVTFGESADAIKEWSKTTAGSFGIARVEALRAAGEFGNMLEPLGFTKKEAADLSPQLVQLASDLASFHNADPTDMLERLRAGLAGQSRPLRIFGIQLLASRVNAEALRETGKKSTKQLTEQEKVTARIALIFRDSANAQGDFARTQESLANQSRILSANMQDLAGTIGQLLLPTVQAAVTQVNDLFKGLDLLRVGVERLNAVLPIKPFFSTPAPTPVGLWDKAINILKGSAQDLGGIFSNLGSRTHDWVTELGAAIRSGNAQQIVRVLGELGQAGASAGEGLDKATEAQKRLNEEQQKAPAPLATRATQIQTQIAIAQATGDVATEAALRRQRLATNRAALARLEQQRQTARVVARENQLSAVISQDENRLATIREDAARKSKAAADRIKQAAEDAAQAQEQATEAFISQFEPRRRILEQRLTTAELSGTARQQIAANQAIIAADAAEIRALRRLIAHKHLHGAALKAALAEITRLQDEIFDTQNAIRQIQAQRRQAAIDARQAHLEAVLSIAESNAGIADDRRALNALIAFDKAQIDRLTKRIASLKKKRKATQDERAQLDAYRVDLAQRREALRNLTDETNKGKTAAQKLQEAEFAFLQTLTGFTANLIGNLIPGGLTSGLVGGGAGLGISGAPTAPSNVRPASINTQAPFGGNHPLLPPRGAGTPAPASSGQSERQIDLLYKIWQGVLKLNRSSDHPEAKHQRKVGASIADSDSGTRGLG